MKQTLFTLLIAFFSISIAIGQQSYTMFETNYLTPKPGKSENLKESLEAHNKKFHTKSPHEAFISYVAVGKHEGQYVWLMGPTTFTALDTRPDDEAHNADWESTVMPYIESSSDNEYWKRKNDLSYNPEGDSAFKLQHIRFWGIKPGKWETFMATLKNVVEVFKTNKYPESWGIYVSQFSSSEGRDVASVSNIANWAYFDTDDTWVADYEKIHGEGSWKTTMETFNDCTESYTEEVRELY